MERIRTFQANLIDFFQETVMKLTLMIVAASLGAVACATGPGSMSAPGAVAQLQSTIGNPTSGTVNFTPSGGKVLVRGEVRGLKPNAEHGFHVHEKGDCSSGDGMSTGGHFNPDGKPHGNHSAAARHAGDLPSLKADASGIARFSFETTAITISSGMANVVGKGLIVHKDPDDYTTQPTGNSGARLACAVIAMAN